MLHDKHIVLQLQSISILIVGIKEKLACEARLKGYIIRTSEHWHTAYSRDTVRSMINRTKTSLLPVARR